LRYRSSGWVEHASAERSEAMGDPRDRPRAKDAAQRRIWLTSLDNFRNWLGLGLQPAKSDENRPVSRTGWRPSIERTVCSRLESQSRLSWTGRRRQVEESFSFVSAVDNSS
jgi:hypothetical protein